MSEPRLPEPVAKELLGLIGEQMAFNLAVISALVSLASTNEQRAELEKLSTRLASMLERNMHLIKSTYRLGEGADGD